MDVELTPRDGSGTAVLTVPQEGLALLDVDSISPEPVTQSSRGDAVVFEFELSGDQQATITFSGRIPVKEGPRRTRWWLQWEGDDRTGAGPARTEMTTWVLP